jgi:GTP-binding protein
VNGRRIKPKYMAQTKARPPTFVLFSTRAEQLPESYRRYLINSLRESFELPGVPLRVSLRSSRNPFVAGEEPPPRRRKAEAAAAPGAETPKPAKPKPKPKGSPRGRTQKLNRPGVKPKRASRPASTRRKPR